MKNTVQVNYWTLGGFEGKKPISQALREAKDFGYDGVELAFAPPLTPGLREVDAD